jgi:hypothetical protein
MKRCVLALLCLLIPAAHANSLTRAYVHRVESASAGSEIVSGRTTTAKDHGGAWLYIYTDEIGYGRQPQARLLSNSLREIAKVPICNVGGGVGTCRRGDTVVGYRRTWDASGHQGGNFEYVVHPAGSGSAQRVTFQVQ